MPPKQGVANVNVPIYNLDGGKGNATGLGFTLFWSSVFPSSHDRLSKSLDIAAFFMAIAN